MIAASSESARSSIFDRGLVETSGGIMASGWRVQFADEPANIARLHGVGRDGDFLDVVAFGAAECAKFKPRGSRRDLRELHASMAFRAAQSLDGKQRDDGG